MANPVFERLENQWTTQGTSTTPNGYPTMPGYQPGQAGSSARSTNNGPQLSEHTPYSANTTGTAQGGDASQTGTTGYPGGQYDMSAYEEALRAPSADATDRGVMTYDDVIVKTGLSFAVLLVGAVAGWTFVLANISLAAALSGGAALVAFILAMVNSFSRTIRPALILAYALFEGFALGAISQLFEVMYPGIVLQAVLATGAIFTVTLILFASGRVRNSSKLARFTLIALIGIVVYRLLSWALTAFGVISQSFDSYQVMGIPLGVVVGLFAVLVGAFCLIQDFDQAKVGVDMGVPRKYAWACAFGLMVTVVWMYLEILRLLSYLRND